MIHLTRLNHIPVVLNSDLIDLIETTPDTVISLTTGQKLVVLEPADEVVRRVVEFRRAIYHSVPDCPMKARTGTNDVPGGQEGDAADSTTTHARKLPQFA